MRAPAALFQYHFNDFQFIHRVLFSLLNDKFDRGPQNIFTEQPNRLQMYIK